MHIGVSIESVMTGNKMANDLALLPIDPAIRILQEFVCDIESAKMQDSLSDETCDACWPDLYYTYLRAKALLETKGVYLTPDEWVARELRERKTRGFGVTM